MTDNSNPLKRQRLDAEEGRPQPKKKHETLYIPDGNIVLSAQNKEGDAIVFCVHRSTLCRASPVFNDMFALPPSGVNDMFEGLPIVDVQDKAEDLELLLKVFYYEISLPIKRLDQKTPTVIAPLLSLANKYMVDQLRTQIVERLAEDWPASLQDWDTLESEIEGMKFGWHAKHQCSGEWTCSKPIDAHLPEPVSAINFAKECGVPEILPAAYYHLSRLELRWPLPDLEVLHVVHRQSLYSGKRTANWDGLCRDDLFRLVAGSKVLRDTVLYSIRHWPENYHHELHLEELEVEHDECDNSFMNEIRQSLSSSEDFLGDSRRYLLALEGDGSECKGLCSHCYTRLQLSITGLRTTVWRCVPGAFRINAGDYLHV